MSIDGGIPGSSGQIFPLSVRNMFSISLDIPFSESKVDDENFVTHFIEADTKIVRFYVAMQKMPVVNVFDPRDHLIDDHQNCL
jgi:hypothetical protein